MPVEPDRLGKSVRFGCGAIVGFFFGLLALLRGPGLDWPTCLAGAAVIAVVFGLLARYLGDDFWHSVFHWLRWW